MPLIYRVTQDMFEFSDVATHMVNPVNLVGVMGKGLALEFRKRVPACVEAYQEACRTKELRVGTVQVFDDTGEHYSVINFPTKRHYLDTSSADDIKRGLEALRNLLIQDKYRYSVIGMPMLGCGLGKQDYEVVLPLMQEFLDNLEATVFLSMSPDRTDLQPRYLTIAGPLDYGVTQEQQNKIDYVIDQVLTKWGRKLSDYTGVISGGYPGVDEYVCGSHYNQDYHNTLVYRLTGKKPLVAKPDTVKNGVGANLHLGNLLCEIGDDIILFKPKGHNNNRLSAMQSWLETDSEKRRIAGIHGKTMAIFGEKDNFNVHEEVIVPTEADIPY